MRRQLSFVLGVFLEGCLFLVALGWALLFGDPLQDYFSWNVTQGLTGVLAAFPLLAFFIWSVESRLPVFTRHRDLLDSIIRKLFSGWAVWQLAAISICAGICEEALFRGAIQTSLTGWIGSALAVAVGAVLFGAAHFLSWTYAIIAALLGAYLGLLFLFSGNLLVPITTHAVYDFLALVYLLKRHQARRPQ